MLLPDRNFIRSLVLEKKRGKNWEYRPSVCSVLLQKIRQWIESSEFLIIRAHQRNGFEIQEFNFNGAPQAPQTPQWNATADMSVYNHTCIFLHHFLKNRSNHFLDVTHLPALWCSMNIPGERIHPASIRLIIRANTRWFWCAAIARPIPEKKKKKHIIFTSYPAG